MSARDAWRRLLDRLTNPYRELDRELRRQVRRSHREQRRRARRARRAGGAR